MNRTISAICAIKKTCTQVFQSIIATNCLEGKNTFFFEKCKIDFTRQPRGRAEICLACNVRDNSSFMLKGEFRDDEQPDVAAAQKLFIVDTWTRRRRRLSRMCIHRCNTPAVDFDEHTSKRNEQQHRCWHPSSARRKLQTLF